MLIGYDDEFAWAANIRPCASADDFAIEHAFVVCNSGMKAQVARGIFERVRAVLEAHPDVLGAASNPHDMASPTLDSELKAAFRHPGKTSAIAAVWRNRFTLFRECQAAEAKGVDALLEFLVSLRWIGEITKWHLAKNLGVDCCKPDRHLVRIAGISGEAPIQLCARISAATGDRVAMVDLVIWRAANLGLA